jgi:hypothetical protein
MGKTTIAKLLSEEGFVRMSFADPIKHIAARFFDILGVNAHSIVHKDRPLPTWVNVEVTARKVWQTLGTEWGRECIDQDLWVEIAKHRVAEMLKETEGAPVPIVFDDVRFLNEFNAIEQMGGEVWRVDRRGVTSNGHVSDARLNDGYFDAIIFNDGTIDELRYRVNLLLDRKKAKDIDQMSIDFEATTYAEEAPPSTAYNPLGRTFP